MLMGILQVPKYSVPELLVLGQLRWIEVIVDWRMQGEDPDKFPKRIEVMLKFALDFKDLADAQGVKLLSSMVLAYGKLYPETKLSATLCIWDHWCDVVLGKNSLLPCQHPLPDSLRTMLKSEYDRHGLTVVGSKNNICV